MNVFSGILCHLVLHCVLIVSSADGVFDLNQYVKQFNLNPKNISQANLESVPDSNLTFVDSSKAKPQAGHELITLLQHHNVTKPPHHHEIIAGLQISGPITEYLGHIHQFWKDFTAAHEKIYSKSQEVKKKKQWIENLLRVHQHNEEARAGLHSYFLRANHLSDMNIREYIRQMVRLTHSDREYTASLPRINQKKRDIVIPEEWNWVEQGFITPSWDQGNCGSCYAFSIAGSAEGQFFRKTNTLHGLSVQQIVDCSIFTGNWGCHGGSLRNALRYLLKAGGLGWEEDYPYRGKRQLCHFFPWEKKVNISSYVILPENDEEALEYAIATTGPVACSLDASPYTFQLYHKGIYDDPICSSTRVNHAMLIVGYTKDAWILKNWWGPHWGINGYMFLRKGKNRCAVARYAGYPVVDDVTSFDQWREIMGMGAVVGVLSINIGIKWDYDSNLTIFNYLR